MDSRTYGLYARLSKMNSRRTVVRTGPYVRPVRTASPDGSAVRTARTEVGLSALAARTARTHGPYARPAGTASPDGAAVHTTRRSFFTAVRTARTYGCKSTLAVHTASTYRPYARSVRTVRSYGQVGRGGRTYGPYIRPVLTSVRTVVHF